MGYGLGGSIGAAFAARTPHHPCGRRWWVHPEPAGARHRARNQLNLKMFLFDDNGYASIRMTQKNYFGGRYVGCDTDTGLGIPNWEPPLLRLRHPVCSTPPRLRAESGFLAAFADPGPRLPRPHRPAADLFPEDHPASLLPAPWSRTHYTT